jgi:hypothetical protein
MLYAYLVYEGTGNGSVSRNAGNIRHMGTIHTAALSCVSYPDREGKENESR